MKILSSNEMKNMDIMTIEKYIPGLLLMEKAALNITEEIRKRFENRKKLKIIFICGPGNNGGDGFAAARDIADEFEICDILFLGKKEKLSEDALINYKICEKLELSFVENIEKNYDIIVDAIFGIGLKKEISGRYFEIIEKINNIKAYKIAVDIASGVSADSGKVLGVGTKADLTVTFHKAKIGHFLYPGRAYTGELIVSDIGIPEIVSEQFSLKREAMLKADIDLKRRDKEIHKGDAGKILVIAGNRKYTGAAYLASESCVISGAGLVTLAVPQSINSIMALKTVEVMNYPLSEELGGFGEKAYEEIKELINESKPDTLLIGPGIGREKNTVDFVIKLIKNIDIRFIIDADALYAIKDNLDILKDRKAILTPHLGEFKRLIGKEPKDRLIEAEDFADRYGVVMVLKGADTVVTDGVKTYINTSGNPGMAVGGMGDMLSGIIAAFSCREEIIDASKKAVYIHGYCGDRVKDEIGEMSLTPSLMLKSLRDILKEF